MPNAIEGPRPQFLGKGTYDYLTDISSSTGAYTESDVKTPIIANEDKPESVPSQNVRGSVSSGIFPSPQDLSHHILDVQGFHEHSQGVIQCNSGIS